MSIAGHTDQCRPRTHSTPTKMTLHPCGRLLGGFREVFELFSGKQRERPVRRGKMDSVPWKEGGLGVCHITLSQLYHWDDLMIKACFLKTQIYRNGMKSLKKLKSQKHITKGTLRANSSFLLQHFR